MNEQQIVLIEIDKIYPHPDNPRKDVGDVTELADSIKKNGIMQNLTVIPGHGLTNEEWEALAKEYKENPSEELRQKMNNRWSNEGYTLIIGHRRCAAAKLAEVIEVPCRIVREMSHKDQVSTMLEENIQRNDLTIFEQAQGFQMMLDLGETEETLVDKTGFSQSTIRHRLNIAKLNQKELKKKEQDDNFQLSLKDLYELEKVKDIKTRNKILKEATNSRELISKVQFTVAEIQRNNNAKKIIALLNKLGVEKAPERASSEIYTSKWETVKRINLSDKVPANIRFKDKDTKYYLKHYREILIIKKAKRERRVETKEDIERKQRDKNKKQIKAKVKEMGTVWKDFIQNIISEKIEPLNDTSELQELIWQVIVKIESFISMNKLASFFLNKEYYDATEEERKIAVKEVQKLSVLHQMLIAMLDATNRIELVEWNGKYNAKGGEILKILNKALGLYGFTLNSDEEQELLNGTHELFAKSNETVNNH